MMRFLRMSAVVEEFVGSFLELTKRRRGWNPKESWEVLLSMRGVLMSIYLEVMCGRGR